ncbi:MAG: hypothetical protein AB7O59_19500 [Pirellulales bacterium]
MHLADRIGRSLFVALAVGLGWGIRGDFGHVVGAMFPGACLGLGLAYVSGQRSLFLWMPIIAALSALGIGLGGTMSYGILHGYAQSDTPINYGYGFVTLFLQGSAWGTFGGALIGLVLERKPMTTVEWLGWLGSIFMGGWLTAFLVIVVLDFDINPPRNNSSIAMMGAALAQILWLAASNKPSGLRGAVLGYVGFGLGMSVGRLLGNLANVLQAQFDFTINHWNVMETSCGMIGGFIFTFGMVNRPYPEPPEKEGVRLASVFGMIYLLGLIPLWHRLGRIRTAEKLAEWTERLKGYQYADPAAHAESTLWWIDAVCVLGFVGAALWIAIYFARAQRLAAFPVVWLCGTMLLFQNLNALYFYYPRDPKLINMHNVFWMLFIPMVLYAVFVRLQPTTVPAPTEGAREPRFHWLGWLAGAAATVGLVIVLAGFINNEQTMRSANTRWPQWTWTEGPFPRDKVGP